MISITDFGNKELISAIVSWIRSSNAKYSNPESIAMALEDNSWLLWAAEQLEKEKAGNYQDGI